MKTTSINIFVEDLGLKPCYEVNAVVDIEHCDDSDYNRETGYGKREHIGNVQVVYLDITEVDRQTGDILDRQVTNPYVVAVAEEKAIELAREKLVEYP